MSLPTVIRVPIPREAFLYDILLIEKIRWGQPDKFPGDVPERRPVGVVDPEGKTHIIWTFSAYRCTVCRQLFISPEPLADEAIFRHICRFLK